MSARQLKKLRDLKETKDIVELKEEEDEEDEVGIKRSKAFAFSDDSEEESEEEEEKKVEKVVIKKETSSKKQNNKKNKNKNKTKIDEDDELLSSIIKAEDISIENKDEEIIKSSSYFSFQIESKFLNEVNELKLQFGSEAVEEDRMEKAAEKAKEKGMKGRTLAKNMTNKSLNKHFLLTTPNVTEWGKPPSKISGGMGMKLISSKDADGVGLFEFEYSSSYEGVQHQFTLACNSYDPNSIFQLLHYNPYHVDSMLQLSELFQTGGEMEKAGDMLKRALYVLESAWHPSFMANGNCRLNFSSVTNRPFFVALNAHMRNMGRKGCQRSAFNLCRFILSLDPMVDPMGIAICIDYYALVSRQFKIFLDFSNWQGLVRGIKFSTLPNILYSRALALFKEEDKVKAAEALRLAILSFPFILIKLVEALSLREREDWREILSHALYSNPESPSEFVDKFATIYIARHIDLWQGEDVFNFLKINASGAAVSIDSDSPIVKTASGIYEEVVSKDMAWSDLASVLGSEVPSYRTVNPADYNDKIERLPDNPWLNPHARALRMEEGGGDEMDPDQIEAMMRQVQAQMAEQGGNLDMNANALLLFLQTLLPWNRLP